MKITSNAFLTLALAAIAVSSTTATRDDVQRKLMLSPDYKGGDCDDQGCPDQYAPVCGSDGVTYSNECNLSIEKCNHPEKKLTMVLDGECPTQRKLMFSEGYQGGDCEDQGCPDDYAPVCGSDGVTYSNECNLGLEKCNHPEKKLTKSLDGECPTM